MRERPILFSAPMVRAILDGRKTQTRRVIKLREFKPTDTPGYDWIFRDRRSLWNDYTTADLVASKHNPYGAPGDRLWVREAFAYSVKDPDSAFNDEYTEDRYDIVHRATAENTGEWTNYDENGQQARIAPPWKPSIHMPRWASRITLEVTAVRVERLRDISEEDAQAEGVTPYVPGHGAATADELSAEPGLRSPRMYRFGFEQIWHDINGAESWDVNPFVWVVEFKRINPPAAVERAGKEGLA